MPEEFFEVGDVVVCVGRGSNKAITEGKKYTIVGVCCKDFVDIIDDLNKPMCYFSYRFKKVEKEMTEEFKVGDTVVCVDTGSSNGHITKGKMYSVIKSYGGSYTTRRSVGIIDDRGVEEVYFTSRFKKVEKEKEMNYDFVKTETKRTIKDGAILIDTMTITNGSVKGVVRLSICNGFSFAALDSSDIDELIKRLQVVKEILDSNK